MCCPFCAVWTGWSLNGVSRRRRCTSRRSLGACYRQTVAHALNSAASQVNSATLSSRSTSRRVPHLTLIGVRPVVAVVPFAEGLSHSSYRPEAAVEDGGGAFRPIRRLALFGECAVDDSLYRLTVAFHRLYTYFVSSASAFYLNSPRTPWSASRSIGVWS